MDNYTKEQVDDIRVREKEALETLSRLKLTPACQIVKERIELPSGKEGFVDVLYPYLQDFKYVRDGNKYVENGVESPYMK